MTQHKKAITFSFPNQRLYLKTSIEMMVTLHLPAHRNVPPKMCAIVGNAVLMTEAFSKKRKWASLHLQGSIVNLLFYWSPWVGFLMLTERQI